MQTTAGEPRFGPVGTECASRADPWSSGVPLDYYQVRTPRSFRDGRRLSHPPGATWSAKKALALHRRPTNCCARKSRQGKVSVIDGCGGRRSSDLCRIGLETENGPRLPRLARAEMTPGRRAIQFESLDEIMPEVDRLLEGHTTVGNWSLAQICRHLATVLRRVVDLPATTPHDPSQWVGEEGKRQFFESGLVPEGIPTSPQLVPVEGARRARGGGGIASGHRPLRGLAGARRPPPPVRVPDQAGVGPLPLHPRRPPPQLRDPRRRPSLKEDPHAHRARGSASASSARATSAAPSPAASPPWGTRSPWPTRAGPNRSPAWPPRPARRPSRSATRRAAGTS